MIKIRKISNTPLESGGVYNQDKWDEVDKTTNAPSIKSVQELLAAKSSAAQEDVDLIIDSFRAAIKQLNTQVRTYHPVIISFNISSYSRSGEEGMTWEEWVDTDYNLGIKGFGNEPLTIVDGELGCTGVNILYNGNKVLPTDELINGATYSWDI